MNEKQQDAKGNKTGLSSSIADNVNEIACMQ